MKKEYLDKIINKSNKVYNKIASKYKISSDAVLWHDQQTQYFRFAELIKYLDLNSTNKTILDIGCGNCELYKFLNFMGFRGHYIGYDINKVLLKQAKKRFSNIDVHCVNILTEKVSERYDYVLMSGLFNVNVGQTLNWVHEFLEKMFSLCKKTVVFNAISTHVNYRSKEMFYLDPAKLLSFCIENISPRVILAHHSLPYNYTVAIYREKNWVSINK